MGDIAAVMVTIDRTPSDNYLAETLENLKRSDLLTSDRLHSFWLVDSVTPKWAWAVLRSVISYDEDEFNVTNGIIAHDNFYAGCKMCPNLNVAKALRHGASQPVEWVLFLEDDIDVIDKFFGSVGAWLDKHGSDHLVYAMGANYPAVKSHADYGLETWDYPVDQFYGTQAFAMRPQDALDLADYIEHDPYLVSDEGRAWDIIMAKWAESLIPPASHFLCACPAFVQHTGRTSIVNPREATHIFPSFPGIDWSYGRPYQRRVVATV